MTLTTAPRLLARAALLLAAGTAPVVAQPVGSVGQYSDATITGTVLEPRKLELPADEMAALLRAPDGFEVSVFASDLINPRMLAVAEDGTVYATRRTVGDVIMMRDENGDGRADDVRTVASRPNMHGIAIDGRTVYLATVNDVYTAPINDDGTFGELTRIINDLPDAGQHPNRTLAVGPDDRLYISVGSTCNACAESSPESATLLRAAKDGTSRTIFAKGLRNTIGFAFAPETGTFVGFDHGIDWLGDEAQIEEVNVIEEGKDYGWPYIYGMGDLNPQDNPPEGLTLEDMRAQSTNPVVGYTPHAAPMQMAFYDGTGFPEEYRGDAFVAMRGSWNRRPPSGYEIARIRMDDTGRPTVVEHFLEGFLIQQEDGSYGFLGRPTGLAVTPDGAVLVSDDTNGVIYRVSHTGADGQASATPTTGSASSPATGATEQPRDGEIAIAMVEPSGDASLSVSSAFAADQSIPARYSADGDNASPPVSWDGAPEGTRSFVLVMDDPDADQPKPFTHWIVYDVPAEVTSLREGLPTTPILQQPEGLKQGVNSMGATGYFGMKPPVGDEAHRYHVQVFALEKTLDLKPGATRQAVLDAMKGHVLAAGEIVGTFARN